MEELAAAEEAKNLIETLSPISTEAPDIVETLRRAYDQARREVAQGFSSDAEINELRMMWSWHSMMSLDRSKHELLLKRRLVKRKVSWRHGLGS